MSEDDGAWLFVAGEEADSWRCVAGEQIGETLHVRRDPHGVPAALEIRTFVFVRNPWPSEPK